MIFPFPKTHTYQDRKDPDVLISFDNRHYPILFAKPHKGWADDAVRYFYEEWRSAIAEYAVADGKKLVVIFDMRSSTVPPATVRKTAGDYSTTDKTLGGLLRTFVVVDNPMLRGVVTAIMWLAGEIPMSFVGTMPEAIKRATRELEQSNVRPPDIDPETYVFPMPT